MGDFIRKLSFFCISGLCTFSRYQRILAGPMRETRSTPRRCRISGLVGGARAEKSFEKSIYS